MAFSEYRPLLLPLLEKDSGDLADMSQMDWEMLLRQCRSSLLMGSVAHQLLDLSADSAVPERVKMHFRAALAFWRRQREEVAWQVNELAGFMRKQGQPLVLLKGAAYMISDMENAIGRSFNDIDCLVPESQLEATAEALRWKGWYTIEMTAYDRAYYRRWMHELPPMRNLRNGATLDIHHAILPLTARYKPDTRLLFEKLRPTDIDNVYTLCPEDMIIHSATHLFHEGEFDNGLRDLVDIRELLHRFARYEPGFWEGLVPRALELDLIRPLYYGLHYSREVLSAEIPEQVMQDAQKGAPNPIMRKVMDWLFIRALRPDHPSCDLPGKGLARWLLYVRSHYLRMPLYLLVPHLVRKAWKRQFNKPDAETAAV